MWKPGRALLSVSDKTGLVDLARSLSTAGVELLSTGGSAKTLRDAGIAVTDVAEVTGFPEIMGGRVKTLHPMIHGGILARRGTDEEVMQAHGIAAIDLVIVNLYPFEQTINAPGTDLATAIENIDIGGPAMIRAAAKNHASVLTIVDPADYASTLDAIAAGTVDEKMRREFAARAYTHTACYDAAISGYLTNAVGGDVLGERLAYGGKRQSFLRYGENPHQRAAFYQDSGRLNGTLASADLLQGKELSYNNIADGDAALECVRQFAEPACVIVKHANPCGVAVRKDIDSAYEAAYATDPTSAFGGIIAFNRPLDAKTALKIIDRQFVEVIIAPALTDGTGAVLAKKKNIRVLITGDIGSRDDSGIEFKKVSGGMLVQERDAGIITANDLTLVSKRAPSDDEVRDMLFAWKVVKHVKSNAIVFCKDEQTIGIGAGQMSRVYSTKIAAIKAADEKLSVNGSVMASDAFFPFRDGIDSAVEHGISAVIQPGGSMRDDEVITAANEHGLAMMFTGMRHFKH